MTKDKVFFRIENSDGKIWLMPNKNIKTAFELYQPGSRKGKLLKTLFPYLKNSGFVRSKLKITRTHIPLSQNIIDLFEKIFNIKNPEISVFLGTPSVHQKITVQIFSGKKILGYAKISDKEEIKDLFLHEKNLLSKLHVLGIKDVPTPLNCMNLEDGKYIFIQDTRKSPGVKIQDKWTGLHEKFLEDLTDKTCWNLSFEDTDWYSSLRYLKENLERISDEIKRFTFQSSINELIKENENKTLRVAAYHADFTPWNMFFDKNGLYVFDWEYASMSYPSGLDKYHFHLQQYIHVDHLSADEIIEKLRRQDWFDSQKFRIYLLDIISRYLKREKKTLSSAFLESLELWVILLQKTTEK